MADGLACFHPLTCHNLIVDVEHVQVGDILAIVGLDDYLNRHAIGGVPGRMACVLHGAPGDCVQSCAFRDTEIHAAVTRRRADGSPDPEGWYPEQRLTVTEAVHAYTAGPAYASGEEAIKGSLTPGKRADLVVLSRDIFAIDPMELLHTEVVATLLDGEFVYRQDDIG